MQPLSSYLEGRWIEGTGQPAVLVNPSTEEPVAEIHRRCRVSAARWRSRASAAVPLCERSRSPSAASSCSGSRS